MRKALAEFAEASKLGYQPRYSFEVSALLRRANLAVEVGELDTAESYVQSALTLYEKEPDSERDPEDAHSIHELLGRIALRRGDRDAATAKLATAATFPARDPESYGLPELALAQELLDLGERDAVVRFLKAYPQSRRRGGSLSELTKSLERGETPELELSAQRVASMASAILNARALELWKRERIEPARTLLLLATRSNPRDATSFYNLACVEARLRNKPAALSALKTSLSLDPSVRAHAKTDTDLDPLRSETEFQALMN